MQLDSSTAFHIFDSIVSTLQTNADEFVDWWSGLDSTYRAVGCFVASMLMMLEATRLADRDRRFFLYGFLSLLLLSYAAVLFVGRTHL